MNLSEALRRDFPGISEKDILEYQKDDLSNYDLREIKNVIDNEIKGEFHKVTIKSLKYYPGNSYKLNIYLPEGKDSNENYNSLFILDGSSFLSREITPFSFPIIPIIEMLISKKKIPPIACVFIDPCDQGPGYPIYGGNDNRSFEYDSCDSRYSDFLRYEVIPTLEVKFPISFEGSTIMGASSAGSASFGAAWNHPDIFSKALISISSFVNIRGADKYIDMVRKEDKKDIKIYMQDGSNDLNTILGDWSLANLMMASSLNYKGYNFIFNRGSGGHNYFHLSEVVGDALVWLLNDN